MQPGLDGPADQIAVVLVQDSQRQALQLLQQREGERPRLTPALDNAVAIPVQVVPERDVDRVFQHGCVTQPALDKLIMVAGDNERLGMLPSAAVVHERCQIEELLLDAAITIDEPLMPVVPVFDLVVVAGLKVDHVVEELQLRVQLV